MKTVFVVILALIIVGLAAGGLSVRKELLKERKAVDAAWAQVDATLQHRADLIPNAAEMIKHLSKRESPVFQEIAKARNDLNNGKTPQERLAANDHLSIALARLLLLSENYPQLHSNRNFQRVQDEIAEAENRIAVERRKYNETLQHYNTSIQVFPNNIVAGVAGFHRNDAYFRTEPGG
ncbi:MAG: LemA family protein [Acidobacteriia bacterium]|nr:LemA family protein [Terriglobia bacterium]